jgi:hypothetical protein
MTFRPTACSPATTLAELTARGSGLTIKCGVCGRSVQWSDLSALPKGATLGTLAARLRCDVCGATEGSVYAVNVRKGGGHSA